MKRTISGTAGAAAALLLLAGAAAAQDIRVNNTTAEGRSGAVVDEQLFRVSPLASGTELPGVVTPRILGRGAGADAGNIAVLPPDADEGVGRTFGDVDSAPLSDRLGGSRGGIAARAPEDLGTYDSVGPLSRSGTSGDYDGQGSLSRGNDFGPSTGEIRGGQDAGVSRSGIRSFDLPSSGSPGVAGTGGIGASRSGGISD